MPFNTILYKGFDVSAGKEYVRLEGSFAPAGAGAPTDLRGEGFTVARTSAGLFTLTFPGGVGYELVKAEAHLQLATGDDKFAQVGTYTASAKTLTIRVWDISGAAETDVAANANNRINFSVTWAKNS